MAGYTFGALSTPGNGSSGAILPIVKCHSMHACVGGETSFQCFPGYVDTRCACKQAPNLLQPDWLEPSLCTSGLPALGFGCRCGTCDIGYYGLAGQCHECGDMRLVFFLSRALPANGIVAITAFLYWGGMAALLSGERVAVETPVEHVAKDEWCGWLQLRPTAECSSWSRFWIR
jgi:hypothetical protein